MSYEVNDFSFYNLFITLCKKHNGPVPSRKDMKQPFYYGTAQSLNVDPEIVRVGTTPEEAINAYMKYAEEIKLVSPWKLYPISYTLFWAMRHLEHDNLSPSCILIEQNDEDAGVDVSATVGMVDLRKRTNPYPSVYMLNELLIYCMNKVNDIYYKSNNYLKGVLYVSFMTPFARSIVLRIEAIRSAKSIPTKFFIHNTNPEPDEVDLYCSQDVSIEIADSALFHFWYTINRVYFDGLYKHISGISPDIVLSKLYQKNMSKIEIEFYNKPDEKMTNMPTITFDCLFPFTDTEPAISVSFTGNF